MLFNSYQFIFLFLPITWLGYYFIFKIWNSGNAIFWLIFCSLFFYSWWNPIYFFLIILSILINFFVASLINNYEKKIFLILGILFNISLLAYFKYYNFFVEIVIFTSNLELITKIIILPLGISFYTFQQITFLVDVHNKKINNVNFKDFVIFITFFPQLIAGPIVHHTQVLYQFKNNYFNEKKLSYLSIGFSIFVIGLFKKVVIADNLAFYSSPIFFAANHSMSVSFLEAWSGILCYSLQIYFDFSGYSDMAIGLGYMFGIKLPLNFNSPYKASDIGEFWRRWHITLGIFFKNYVFYPLSLFFTRLSLRKKRNKYINYTLTMFMPSLLTYTLIGVWHGSGINFLLFGTMHAFFIIINNIWKRSQGIKIKNFYKKYSLTSYLLSCFLVFLSFSISLVFFRAPTYESAVIIYKAMLSINNTIIPESWFLILHSLIGQNLMDFVGINHGLLPFFFGINQILIILLLYLFCLLAPNTKSLFHDYFPSITKSDEDRLKIFKVHWKPNIYWSIVICFLFTYTVMNLSNISEFIYFQF